MVSGVGFEVDAGVAFGVDARVGFGVEAIKLICAFAFWFLLVLVQGVLYRLQNRLLKNVIL